MFWGGGGGGGGEVCLGSGELLEEEITEGECGERGGRSLALIEATVRSRTLLSFGGRCVLFFFPPPSRHVLQGAGSGSQEYLMVLSSQGTSVSSPTGRM